MQHQRQRSSIIVKFHSLNIVLLNKWSVIVIVIEHFSNEIVGTQIVGTEIFGRIPFYTYQKLDKIRDKMALVWIEVRRK